MERVEHDSRLKLYHGHAWLTCNAQEGFPGLPFLGTHCRPNAIAGAVLRALKGYAAYARLVCEGTLIPCGMLSPLLEPAAQGLIIVSANGLCALA